MRRLDAEGAKEGDVLGGVGEMILAANDVGDLHFQIVHHIDKMKNGLAVGADDDEIGVGRLAVSEFAQDVAHHQIGNQDGPAVHFELDSAVGIIGQALVPEFLDAAAVNVGALRLEVRAVISQAGAGRIAAAGPFVPIQTEPAQAAQDHFGRFLGVAGRVGVLNARIGEPPVWRA